MNRQGLCSHGACRVRGVHFAEELSKQVNKYNILSVMKETKAFCGPK